MSKGCVLIVESEYVPRGQAFLAGGIAGGVIHASASPMLVIGPDTPEEFVGRFVNHLRDEGYEVAVDRPLRPCP